MVIGMFVFEFLMGMGIIVVIIVFKVVEMVLVGDILGVVCIILVCVEIFILDFINC